MGIVRLNAKKILQYLTDKTKGVVMPSELKTAFGLDEEAFDLAIQFLREIDAVDQMDTGHFEISSEGVTFLKNYDKNPGDVQREEIDIINARLQRISKSMLTLEKLEKEHHSLHTQRGI
jgi:hypothetical protein